MTTNNKINLTTFLKENSKDNAINEILSCVQKASDEISVLLENGYFDDTLEKKLETNESGDLQSPLDMLSNNIFINLLKDHPDVLGIVSEELEHPYYFDDHKKAQYVLMIDPLDGSANLPINAAVSTIFSIVKIDDDKVGASKDELLDHLLKISPNPVCAGYVVYSFTTYLMFTTGDGVHGFNLNQETGEFILVHHHVKIPEDTHMVAVNSSNKLYWNESVTKYLKDRFENPNVKKGYNMRWYASVGVELHRILLQGGIFLYPTTSNGKPHGVLRKLYEAYPIAMLIEQAGGSATNCIDKMTSIPPTHLHEKTPMAFGSTNEVNALSNS